SSRRRHTISLCDWSSDVCSSDLILQTYRDRAPLRRTVDGGDVAGAALFLLGPHGKGVSAEILMVDAGVYALGVCPAPGSRQPEVRSQKSEVKTQVESRRTQIF